MTFEKLVPNVYYNNINDGLTFFVDCLSFTIGHDEIKSSQPFCVLQKDGLQFFLFESKELAKEHNPEFRLITKNIEAVYEKVSVSHPAFLHPNLNKVTLRPWGAKEFALRDDQVCMILQQW
jgi:predicted HAD superfamily hydrolase